MGVAVVCCIVATLVVPAMFPSTTNLNAPARDTARSLAAWSAAASGAVSMAGVVWVLSSTRASHLKTAWIGIVLGAVAAGLSLGQL